MKTEPAKWKIANQFARWAVQSALRSGSSIKKPEAVNAALDKVNFSVLLDSGRSPIDRDEFKKWHTRSVQSLQKHCLSQHDKKLSFGWAAKMIAIYLKVTCYLAGFGRPGLKEFIHPPIDNNLIKGVYEEFKREESDLLVGVPRPYNFSIEGVKDPKKYRKIIDAFRRIADKRGHTLFEVEQYWRPKTPASSP